MSLDTAVTIITAFAHAEFYSVARSRHGVSGMRIKKRADALTSSPGFIRLAPVLLLSVVAANSHAGSSVGNVDGSRISVTAVAGDVDVTMAGYAATVSPKDAVLLPARVVTGHDGNLGLTQAGTNINVANDTDVEIPAEAADGNLIARLVQHRGNVFYDVAPRDLGKLRVETPLLVAVIKGTQFNVAVQQDSTTISLFEGRLEIRTPDDSEIVQLNAGEIAIRSRTDAEIRIVGMNDERVAAPRAARAAGADARPAVAVADAPVALLDTRLANRVAPLGGGLSVASKPAVDATGVELGGRALEVSVGAGDGRVDGVALDASLDLGRAGVAIDLDAGLDIGGAGDLRVDAGVDLGAGTVDLGLDAGVDLGSAVVDTGVDAGLDLGGALDIGVDAGLDLGGVVDAGVTPDTGTLDLGVDAGVDLGGVLDVGLDVDLGGGTIEVDLGLGGGTAPAPAPTPRGGLGGLLGGLL
jgi:hypothetical protein